MRFITSQWPEGLSFAQQRIIPLVCKMEFSERVIGLKKGEKEGPLFIAIGQMHGNEPAGTQAIQELFELLRFEYHKNPGFQFSGTFVGLIGNLAAAKLGQRFIDKDLNRNWRLDLDFPNHSHPGSQESIERKELFSHLQQLIKDHGQKGVFLLDLHTTTAQGGVFAIPASDPKSQEVAHALHAPVIDKLLENLPGTLVKFVSQYDWGVPVSSLVFESGQHESADAVSHAISALVNCMRSLSMVRPGDVEHKHDDLLIRLAKGLPMSTELVHRHSILPSDQFVMLPGFQNFSPVYKGQQLAHDKNGPIFSGYDGLMLMPLYQTQGEDGFFVLREKR